LKNKEVIKINDITLFSKSNPKRTIKESTMTVKIDNIELDEDNVEFGNAAEFVKHTDRLIYLTGKAGTGKTTFLKYIKKITDKNTVVLAPTGVAAINAGGVTIHSFFQIPFGPFVPNDLRLRTSSLGTENKVTIYDTFTYQEDKRNIIKNLELLIIDEISMVRSDVLDVIDKILRVFRKKPYLPFGGVQVILIGDTFQLPPIANQEEWTILSQFYKTPFFFSAKVIENEKPLYIELKKIYRQNEIEFIDLLNRVRVNQVKPIDFQTLNSKYQPTFSPNGDDYIILATHNRIVNETNLTRLEQLETEEFTYEAKITHVFPDMMKPTDHYLHLKVGAQIMFIRNDSGEQKRYFNGKIGKIKELEKDKIVAVFDNEEEVVVERAEWQNIKYTYNNTTKSIEEEIIGTFQQFPIKLAWAITVHKSQGLTFEKVIADLSGAFASGQVYVALSRCSSFHGLVLKTQLHQGAIKTDPRVLEFAKNETPETLVAEELNRGRADFFYKKSREEIKKENIQGAFEYFKKALKFRNDIETENFKRFIILTGKRLVSQRTYLSMVLNERKNKEDELNEDISRLKEEEINYLEELLSVKSSNEKLEMEIEDFLVRLFKLEKEKSQIAEELNKQSQKNFGNIQKLEKERSNLEKLKLQNKKLKANLLKQKTEGKKKDEKIKDLQSNLNKFKFEIDRINNLKWYQKLRL